MNPLAEERITKCARNTGRSNPGGDDVSTKLDRIEPSISSLPDIRFIASLRCLQVTQSSVLKHSVNIFHLTEI